MSAAQYLGRFARRHLSRKAAVALDLALDAAMSAIPVHTSEWSTYGFIRISEKQYLDGPRKYFIGATIGDIAVGSLLLAEQFDSIKRAVFDTRRFAYEYVALHRKPPPNAPWRTRLKFAVRLGNAFRDFGRVESCQFMQLDNELTLKIDRVTFDDETSALRICYVGPSIDCTSYVFREQASTFCTLWPSDSEIQGAHA